MKIISKILTLLIITLFLSVPVYAAKTASNRTVTLDKNKIIKSDYFAYGDTVTVSGIVEGDAYIAGGTIIVDGTIKGDLFVAGGTVSLQGPILHDLRAAGGTITLQAPISGSVTIAGGTVSFEKKASVMGTVLAGAGAMTLDNQITGDFIAGVGSLTLLSNAKMKGNLTYWSENEIVSTGQATVSGSIVHKEPPKEFKDRERYKTMTENGIKSAFVVMKKTFLVFQLLWGLLLFGLGLLLFHAMPVYTQKTLESVGRDSFNKFLSGLLVVILLPIVGVLLFFTIIGAPIAFIIFAGLGVACIVTHIYSSLFVGTKIMGLFQNNNRTLSYLVGLFGMFVLSLIPVLGGLMKTILGLVVFGALIKQKSEAYALIRKHKIL